MIFNSFNYLLFLLVAVPLFYLSPGQWQAWSLLACSAYFYACGAGQHLWVLLLSILVSYISGLGLAGARSRATGTIVLTVAVVAQVSILVVYKYYDFLLENLSSITPSSLGVS